LAGGARAITTNDIQLWTGSGTNHAALVIEWNSPVVFNLTSVPAPIANKTLVWGYQFNGTATGTQLLRAILASDHRLYGIINDTYGTFVVGLGYNLDGSGAFGVTDGSATYTAATFTNGFLLDPNLNVDAAVPLNRGDLYWSGYYGPNWNVWNEMGDIGGFASSPERGTNQFWDPATYSHGQWENSAEGLDQLPVTDGSWIGFSVGAAGYDANTNDPATAAYNLEEQAPPSPVGNYVAYVCDTNDFAVQIVGTNGVATTAPYNNPAAILGRPTLTFVDYYDGGITNRTSIIDDPYWKSPSGQDVITEISAGGEVTLAMGRKVYHDPNNPYGIDLIVFGNSFFSVSGITGDVSDATDLDTAQLGSGLFGHATTVSVSPDGTNWYAFSNTPALFPDGAYRWDYPNHSWTEELLNANKPVDPAVYLTDFAGQTVATGLEQFAGSAGGTGYSLAASGFPWIQFVRAQPGPNTYTVIDAIAAVNPVVEGDALALSPADLAAGTTNLVFQSPANRTQTLISINFHSISNTARVSTVRLTDFSSLAPVPGHVLYACQATVRPITVATNLTLLADVGLSVGTNYNGTGGDLRVLQWIGTNWTSPPISYDQASRQVWVAGLTNLSAFVVAQVSAPALSMQMNAQGARFDFVPFAGFSYTLQRSTNLVTWNAVATVTAQSEQVLTITDEAPPAVAAFYRLLVNP
jgi:hypothetical protein